MATCTIQVVEERHGSDPQWLGLGRMLLGPILAGAKEQLDAPWVGDAHLAGIPTLALFYLADCLSVGTTANLEGKHAVALSLVRQAVETLNVIELGFVGGADGVRLLRRWDDGRLPPGELRQALERDVWPRYGADLWKEPWAEFFGSLARAVQPYAHYTPELMNWQLAMVTSPESGRWIAAAGPGTYDPIKASRITLLHVLTEWALARSWLANRMPSRRDATADAIAELGGALARADLLVEQRDWAVELWPHMWLKR